MRKDCDTCLHDEFGETYCNDCYWATGKPPTKWEPAPFWTPDTNANRIRAMSDEELADYWMKCTCVCDWCVLKAKCGEDTISKDRCMQGVLEWLKQPAEEE